MDKQGLIFGATRIKDLVFEIQTDLIWAIMGTIGVLMTGAVGLKLVTMRYGTVDKKTMTARVGLLQEYAGELKKDLQRTRGKLSQFQVGPQVNPADLENQSIESVIPKILGEYSGMAPKWLKPILSDPNVSSYLMQLAKEHPEKAKSFIQQFIGSKITDGKGSSPGEPGEGEVVTTEGA